MNIAHNLKTLRNKNQLSQRELEKHTNVNYLTIFRIESGRTKEEKITVDTIAKLSHFFGVKVDDFIFKDLSNVD